MKKNLLYAVLLLVFIGAAGFVVVKFRSDEKKKKTAVYELMERKGVMAKSQEWVNASKNAQKLLNDLKAKPGDTKSMIGLANLYILEARATGNYLYYDKAANRYVDEVLVIEPNNFEALTLKALLFLSQHHFAEGLAMAQQAQKLFPYNASLYGVMVDGHVEMGNYDSAVLCAEKMMSIRPDLGSYARASYLREIHGDIPGAIEAMTLAVEAGQQGDEATEWSRVQLGNLFEKMGEMKFAEMHYRIALNQRPSYVHALAGMARVALADKYYDKAIHLYQQADSLVSDYVFKEELVEVYRLAGQKDRSAATAAIVIDAMSKNSAAAATDETIGHYADKELAYAYLMIGNHDKALEHALAEYNRRPKNIEVNETLAWVYYEKGDFTKAVPYIQEALKTGSKNPVLLCRAGLIYKKAGDNSKAKEYLTQALEHDPNIPALLKLSGEQELKKI
ncbi:MAG: tetratricopeptide repeat protein [Ferruginibacter sp.]